MSSPREGGWHNYSIFAIICFFSFSAPPLPIPVASGEGPGEWEKRSLCPWAIIQSLFDIITRCGIRLK